MSQIQKVPILRFNGFNDEWKNIKLKDVCELKGRIGYRGYTVNDIVNEGEGALAFSPSNISENGIRKTDRNTYISWFKYDESPEIMVKNGYILLVKTGSTYGKSMLVSELSEKATVNPQIVVIKPRDFNSKLLSLIISHNTFQKKIEQTVVGGAIPTISQEKILNFQLFVPNSEEQEKIALFLGAVDEKIAGLQKKKDLLDTYKKGCMQKLFSQQLRFKDNNGNPFPDWEERKLKSIGSRQKKKNIDLEHTRVLTNSATRGVIDQRDYFSHDIANANNLGGYYIVNKGDFVYNPRVSETAPVGPIKQNNLGVGIMSPLYSVFKFKNKNTNFFTQYFASPFWYSYMKSVANYGARHDRMAISSKDFMDMPLPYPHPDEQKKIADFLSAIDDKIALVAEELDKAKIFKKGLLQQMFV